MPQAIAAFIIAAVSATGVAAALITAVVSIAFTVGVSVLFNALFARSRPKPSDGQINSRVAIGSRRRHYGIVHTGGQETFKESAGGTLARVITLGTGEEAEIIEHRINDKPVTVSAGTVTDASFRGAVHIYTRSGTADQTAIGELTAKFAQWTSNHRQRGCPHAAIICDPVKQEHFSEVYNGREPEYTQVRKAAKLYDPRKDSTAVIGTDEAGDPVYGSGAHRLSDSATWEWSDNAALVIADYFAHPDGYGGGVDAVNWANIAAEADHADDTVTTVTDEEIARWRIWASYSLAGDERRQVLADMLRACDGFAWQDAELRFNLMLGRFEVPDITITDDHIIGMTATLGIKAQQRVSAIKVLYTEAAIGYREQESATISDPEAEDDPASDAQAVEAYFAPHHNQASRLGKIIFRQLGDRWHINALLNLYGLNLLGRRFVGFDSADLGVAGYFKIDGLRLNLADLTAEATLSEVRADDWDFDAAEEEGTPPLDGGEAAGPVTIPGPTGLVLTAVQIDLGETNAVTIAASWDDPGRPDLTFEAQYSVAGEAEWIAMGVQSEARTAQSGPVDSGVEYDVRVRSITLLGRPSAWTTASITPVADPGDVPGPGDIIDGQVPL